MVDQAGITWIPNSNCFPGRNGLTPRYVIIHGTAGGTSAVAIANYFASTQNTANPVSSTYVIGVQGETVQCVAERDGAWANGAYTPGHAAFWDTSVNPNNITISIECCKASLDNSDALTTKQFAALCTLVNDICTRNGIPKRAADASGGITGHYSIDPVNRSNCPGTFNWNALWAFLKSPTTPQGGTPVGVPAGWHDDGKTLTAPNNIKVTLGFRDYILTHPWASGNLPLTSAQGLTPLQLSNPSLGGGTRQTFRLGYLEWTSKNGTFEGWIGEELITVLNLYHTAQASLGSLQTKYNNEVDDNKQLTTELNQLKSEPASDAALKAAVASALQPAQTALQNIETLIK